jgi:hypothetical protein
MRYHENRTRDALEDDHPKHGYRGHAQALNNNKEALNSIHPAVKENQPRNNNQPIHNKATKKGSPTMVWSIVFFCFEGLICKFFILQNIE